MMCLCRLLLLLHFTLTHDMLEDLCTHYQRLCEEIDNGSMHVGLNRSIQSATHEQNVYARRSLCSAFGAEQIVDS